MQINPHFSRGAQPRDRVNTLIPGRRTIVSGRRYYNPGQGRFVGRDPIDEQGGLNLYGFCGNNGVNRWDVLGMEPEGVGELGENKTCSEGKEWVFTRNGWVMTADGTGEGQFSGVGALPGWQINGLSVVGVGLDDLASHYNLLGATAPSSGGTPAASSGSVLGSLASGALDLLGKVWALPNTVIGVTAGLVGVLLGGDAPTIGNNGIQFTNNPLAFAGAITLGNAIIYGPGFGPTFQLPNGTVGDHERQHTYQAQVLGPLYLPSNILGLAAGLIFNRDAHGPANWNEVGPQANPPRPWPWD